jgi:hypothetical protein
VTINQLEAFSGASKTGSAFLCIAGRLPALFDAPEEHRGGIFGPPNGQRRPFGTAIKNQPHQLLYSMMAREAR